MLKFNKIVVTGPVASGKSTVCQLFEELGAFTISADEVVHQILSTNTPIIQKVVELLGQEVLVEGKIDRKRVADRVFQDPLLLKSLEELLHPEVRAAIDEKMMARKTENNQTLFVVEIPLYYEGNFEESDDLVLLVDTPEHCCKERFVKSGRGNEKDFEMREQRLLPMEFKRKKANFILENRRDPHRLERAVESLHSQITHQS